MLTDDSTHYSIANSDYKGISLVEWITEGNYSYSSPLHVWQNEILVGSIPANPSIECTVVSLRGTLESQYSWSSQ
jgi:hypothetical protein